MSLRRNAGWVMLLIPAAVGVYALVGALGAIQAGLVLGLGLAWYYVAASLVKTP